jgi:hypothetical protein
MRGSLKVYALKNQLPAFILLFAYIGCTCELPLPEKGVLFVDPDYGTAMVRITDKKSDGYEGNGIQNEYAKADAYNSDSSRIILRSNDAHWYLYDASDYRLVRDLSGIVGLQEPEPRWHADNPDIFYYLYDTRLMQYDVAAEQQSMVHDFKTDFPDSAIITTGTEGDASRDRRYWCFMITDEMFSLQTVCVYDMVDDAVVGTRTSFPDAVNFTSMDASGNHALIGYDSLPYQACSIDFSRCIDFTEGAAGHGDVALSADGSDVMVYQNVPNDFIAMTDLVTGVETRLLEIPFGLNTDIGLHVSGNCYEKPGWVLISTYGAQYPRSGETATWMDHLLFMLELKENPRVIKIAGTHAYTALFPDAVEKNYFAEAFAAVNTAGDRIVFGSNWGVLYPSDYSDAYEVRLPDNWEIQLGDIL